MTKTLKFFTALIALTLASPALAQESARVYWAWNINLYGEGSAPVSAEPCRYADGSLLLPGSAAYLLFVVPEDGVTFAKKDEVPFSIGVDGTVTPGAGVARTEWGVVASASSTVQGIQLGEGEKQGYPAVDPGTFYVEGIPFGQTLGTDFYWPASAGEMPSCYAYLVVFDTRAIAPDSGAIVSVDTGSSTSGNGRTLPSRVTGWGATQCAFIDATASGGGIVGPPVGGSIGPMEVYVGLTGELSEMLSLVVDHVAGPVAVTDMPTLESWKTDAGETLAGADLEAALTPAVSGMVATTMGEGDIQTPAFGFTFTPAQLSDLTTYTLHTATDLAGPWVPFDEVLAGSDENVLALGRGLRYTALRIDGEESVSMTIPRLENDPTRFYRLQGDVEVVTSGQEGE